MPLKDFEGKIQKSHISVLEKGFMQLSEMEVELEDKLRQCREAKARFLAEIGLRTSERKK